MSARASLYAAAMAAAVVASSVDTATAARLRSFSVGPWQAGAYARDGRFTHCAAGATYGSGATMLFSIDRQYRWNMSFLHPGWRLTPGQEYSMVFAIDDGQSLNARGHAVHATQMNVPLAGSMALFDRFRRGLVLRLVVGSRIVSFNLDGTSAMLAQLYDCVRRYTQPATTVANSSGGKRGAGAKGRDPVSDPTLQAEAAVLLANVMSAANVSGYAMGAPEEAAKMGAHAFWTAPAVVGSLLIIPMRRIDDPEIPGLVTGVNATGCKGAFMSASLPSDGNREVRVTTTCQPSGQPLSTSYYFGIPRPRGGLYLFRTTTKRDGGREDAERADEMIRQATLRTVN